jgi:hypothetical protein
MAVTYGLDETYDDSKVSRIEAGLRGLTLEEGALVVQLDREAARNRTLFSGRPS